MPEYRRLPVRYPDPKVPLVAATVTVNRPGTYHRHTDEDWEIWYVSAGRACLRVGGKQHDLQDGDVFIIRPDQPHTCLLSHGLRYVLIFNRRFLKDVPVPVRGAGAAGLLVHGARLPVRFAVPARRRAAVEYAYERLEHESFGREATKRPMLAATDKSATEIAATLGFGNQSHFHRAFHAVVGTSPGRYRALVRHKEQA